MMINEADLNILVSNVISEKSYSHCRLCLKEIGDSYLRFEDCLYLDEGNSFLPLSEILSRLFGQKFCEEIPGLEVACPECVQMAAECSKFINRCDNSTELLKKVFDNLNGVLHTLTEPISQYQRLFIIVGENESKIILSDKGESNKNKSLSYECPDCDKSFTSLCDFKVHSVTVHEKNIHFCQSCHEIFIEETDLNEHIKENHPKYFKCPECHEGKNSLNNLNQHIDKMHTQYICKECGKTYTGLEKLHSHEGKHSCKNECPKCGKTYLTKDSYHKHVELCEKDLLEPHPYRAKIQKSYFCEKCGKGYSTSGGLRVHERFVHGNAKPHVCEQCGKKFTAPSYLKVHMVKHTGEKKFKCNICSNNFVTKEALLYHTRRHTGEKPYSCKSCGERFVNASARAEHIKFKHNAPTLPCHICNRKFYTSSFLRLHLIKHQDPSSKLYTGRSMIPPNMPGEQNMRAKLVPEDEAENKNY